METVMQEEKPDYVKNFRKPKNTEIKHIGRYYYLYERSSTYDPETKKMRKKSGKCLGRITENGLVPSREKMDENILSNIESKEAGLSGCLWNRNQNMIERLKKHFPDIWREMFVMAALRFSFGPRFKRISENYETGIFSEIYPGLNLDGSYITALLKNIGKRTDAIKAFMHEDNDRLSSYLVFDGHRIISDSRTLETAYMGYDSKMRYKNQVNLVYAFSVSGTRCFPYYYKQFSGDVPDITAFQDLIEEAEVDKENLTILADKGFGDDDNFTLIDESGFRYIIPIKRNSKDSKDNAPLSNTGYDDSFLYNTRPILHKAVEKEGYTVHIYRDIHLYSDEMRDITERTDKKNNTTTLLKEKEEERIRKGNKRRLTDEQLKKLKAVSFKDSLVDENTIGTITLRTNDKTLNGAQVYNLYKRRESIEDFFKTYDNSFDFSASYMRNIYSEEGWLFLNHLSAIIGFDILDEIYAQGKTSDISLTDFRTKMSHLYANKIKGTWRMAKTTENRRSFALSFGLDPDAVMNMINGPISTAVNE